MILKQRALIALLFFMNVWSVYANQEVPKILKKLDQRMAATNSLVCAGLDPDPSKMPLSIMQQDGTVEEKVLLFLKKVVNIVSPHVCAFKIQKAFFDQFSFGHDLLHDIIHYIKKEYPEIPVFLDCKIGDTDNTMKVYMDIFFNKFGIDSVVINPYMADDVLQPFLDDANKSAIVLVQTSNPNGKVVQELVLENGKKLWEEMLDITLERWNKNKNLMVVLSSNTSAQDYTNIRKIIPQYVPILLAGMGAQGGDSKVMKQLLNEDNRGVFVGSSRGILYPYQPADANWENAVLKAVLELKAELNAVRGVQ